MGEQAAAPGQKEDPMRIGRLCQRCLVLGRDMAYGEYLGKGGAGAAGIRLRVHPKGPSLHGAVLAEDGVARLLSILLEWRGADPP